MKESKSHSMEPAAAIDLGSNLVRIAFGRPGDGAYPQVTHKLVRVIRIAEGLSSGGILRDASVDRALVALDQLADEARHHGIPIVNGVATGALRLASNRDDVIERIRTDIGIPIEVIEGEREANLSALGVASQAGEGPLLVIDIGGTTTEVILRGTECAFARSFNIGVITLSEQREERDHRAVADATFADLVLPASPPPRCFAAGGAAVALVAYRDGDSFLNFVGDGMTRLDGAARGEIYHAFQRDDPRARADRLGITVDHAGLVPAGCAILEALLARLRIDEVTPTGRGVVEGLLVEWFRRA